MEIHFQHTILSKRFHKSSFVGCTPQNLAEFNITVVNNNCWFARDIMTAMLVVKI